MGMEKKILLVDDEKDIVDMMEEVLNKEGFSHIQKTFTGADALKLCRDFQPDIVILDIMLPDMDGLEVAGRFGSFPIARFCSCPQRMMMLIKSLDFPWAAVQSQGGGIPHKGPASPPAVSIGLNIKTGSAVVRRPAFDGSGKLPGL